MTGGEETATLEWTLLASTQAGERSAGGGAHRGGEVRERQRLAEARKTAEVVVRKGN